MAPISKLLVYYVLENGEGVADSIQLPVTPVLENSVGVQLLFLYTTKTFVISPMKLYADT